MWKLLFWAVVVLGGSLRSDAGYVITVTNGKKVKKLEYSTSANPFAGSSSVPNHEAVFHFRLDHEEGSPIPASYSWRFARESGVPGEDPPADAIIVDRYGHSRTATERSLALGGDVETVSDTTESDPNTTGAITIRAPGSIVVHSTTPGNHASGIPNRHAAKRHDVMRLFDTLGSAMPGVCVQERFTTSVPQGFVVNTDGGGWETRSTSTATMVLLAPGWPDHNQPMSRSTAPGCFHAFDNLTWIWPIGQSNPFSLTHRYFAGDTVGVRLKSGDRLRALPSDVPTGRPTRRPRIGRSQLADG